MEPELGIVSRRGATKLITSVIEAINRFDIYIPAEPTLSELTEPSEVSGNAQVHSLLREHHQ